MIRLLRRAALLLLPFAAANALAQPAPRPGEPYELVRALQAVQDGIANGDTAAHGSHIAMIRQIGEKFLAADPAVWSNPQNSQAVVIYLLSPDLISTLWTTDSGLRLLWFAITMTCLGMLWIRQIIRIHI